MFRSNRRTPLKQHIAYKQAFRRQIFFRSFFCTSYIFFLSVVSSPMVWVYTIVLAPIQRANFLSWLPLCAKVSIFKCQDPCIWFSSLVEYVTFSMPCEYDCVFVCECVCSSIYFLFFCSLSCFCLFLVQCGLLLCRLLLAFACYSDECFVLFDVIVITCFCFFLFSVVVRTNNVNCILWWFLYVSLFTRILPHLLQTVKRTRWITSSRGKSLWNTGEIHEYIENMDSTQQLNASRMITLQWDLSHFYVIQNK